MRAKVPEGRPLRSLAITFVGPLAVDKPARYEAEVLREGKAVSQMLGRVVQDGQVVTIVQGSFGAPRSSVIDAGRARSVHAASGSLPGAALRTGRDAGVHPLPGDALGVGGLPFSGNSSRQMGGWVRQRGDVPREPMTEAHLLALVDAWPPAVLPHLKSFAPGSSLTWTIEFIQPMPVLDSHEWCMYRAEIEHARDGYGHCAAALWSPSGELIALSRQTVTVFG